MTLTPRFPELGFYTLAGHVESPRDMLDELRLAEDLGLGNAFISERLNVKEACALSGGAAAVTSSIDITTAATNINTRHPAISAAFATTMHRLSGGRFVFGIGRGIKPMMDGLGLDMSTTADMEEFAVLMRRLWHGEVVTDYDGPHGRIPRMALDPRFDEDIRLATTAFGPRTLEMAGRHYDLVVLHTFFSDETVRRIVKTVRDSAEQAGRDPNAVKVWSCYATIRTDLPEDVFLKKTAARLATYLQVYGDLMVSTNRWDPALLQRFRESDVVRELGGVADAVATPEQNKRLREVIPDEWMDCAAIGTPAECAEKVRAQLDLGVDGVIMHGATPTELQPIVEAYAAGSPR